MPATKPDDSLMSQAGRYLGVGITLALCTGLFLYLGTVVDKKAGTEPLFTLLGAFVGAAAGFYNLYRTLMSEGGGHSGGEGER
jgi:F0F1-type ATP synthase assembly protein I